MKILREHWEHTKIDNQNMILNSQITIKMAEEVVKLCDRMIATFPAPKITPENIQNRKNLQKRKI